MANSKNKMAEYIGSKLLYVNFHKCYKFRADAGEVSRTSEDNFSCLEHEEADTKIVYHVCKLPSRLNYLIRCSDTDILIILLGNMKHLTDHGSIFMHVGVGNSQRFIDVTSLYATLGESMCSSLPGFHAFTGCDYNPAFFRKGKKQPFLLLEKSEKFRSAFAMLGDAEVSQSLVSLFELFPVIEEFVCRMFKEKAISSVNETRMVMFNKAYQVGKVDEEFQKKS